MNPDDLRSALATAYPDVAPPPDLAARAERRAARIRRRRVGLAAAAVAGLVAVPVAVTGLRHDRALPPAVSVPAGDPCRPPVTLPGQPVATSAEDAAAWGYRGDPALRDTAERVGHLHNDAPTVVPLYAGRIGPEEWLFVVYAANVVGEWHVFAAWAPKGIQGDRVSIYDSVIGKLPRPGPDAAISLLVPTPHGPEEDNRTNTLVVLAPPGSDGITYHGCRLAETFDVTVPGDVLVRDVGALDAQGVLEVRAGDGTPGYSGPAADLPAIQPRPDVLMQAPDPIPVPAGMRMVAQGVAQGGSVYTTDGVIVPGSAEGIRNATVLVRCRADEPAEVRYPLTRDTSRSLGTVPCDGAVHRVAEGIDLPALVAVGTPLLKAGDGPSLPYRVVVVVPN